MVADVPEQGKERAAARPFVLLVDDHVDSLEMLAEFLELSGFRTAQARDGQEALEKARRLRPDAVVTDLSLPVLDGWALTRSLRADEATRGMRILVLSGDAHEGAEGRAREAGCDGFFLKPCLPERLAAEIRRALARAEAARPTP